MSHAAIIGISPYVSMVDGMQAGGKLKCEDKPQEAIPT